MDLQPFLNTLLGAVAAPGQAWSGQDGQIRPDGAQGCYDGDVRVLSRATLTVGGSEPEVLAAGSAGPGAVTVLSAARAVDAPGADPTVRLRRTRTVRPGEVGEELVLEAATADPVHATVEIALASDLAQMAAIKAGRGSVTLPATARGDVLAWSGEDVEVVVSAPESELDLADPVAPVIRWRATAEHGRPWRASWAVRSSVPSVVAAAAPAPSWSTPTVVCDDRRLTRLVEVALEDLHGLRMRPDEGSGDVFLAAGAPWFLTLFGRDSLWAARMLLPLGTDLAGGTLRALAARQGTRHDPLTAEQPGKILHELRPHAMDLGDGSVIPPVYYGTVDATALWVCLLHDAWRWGMAPQEVEDLLPAMERALAWMATDGDADGDGFLEYLDVSGTGLANQGWKDSGDSVQWRDGTLATGPIALCEVQGYAHEAALGGAALLDAFGRPGAARWRRWAAELAERFRASFWIGDDRGPYPAIALDADKRPVDSLTSNIGHLLGTGLLTRQEEELIAARLAGPELDSGYGLRTLAEGSGGYWPLRYHGGSVWTHDTAIALAGLTRTGHGEEAARFVEGLLAAAADQDYRLPELHSGDARGSVPAVVPYPAACRPQAWSAASAVVLLSSVLGLEPNAPAGEVRVSPMAPSPVGHLSVAGLRVAGAELSISIGPDGSTGAVTAPAGIAVV